MNASKYIVDENTIYFITDDRKLLVGISVLMVLVATFTVLANGTVAMAMIQMIVREMRQGAQSVSSSGGNSCVTRLLMLSLACSGVLVGGFLMPLSVNDFINNGKFNSAYDLCVATIYIGYILLFSTNLHKMFIAVDTYLLVRHPLLHIFLTARTGYCLVTITWILPFLLVIVWVTLQQEKRESCYKIVHSFNDFDYSTILSLIFGILFLVLLVSVWSVYFIVLREISKFLKRPLPRTDLSFDFHSTEVANWRVTGNPARRSLNPRAKSFRSFGLILLSLTIGWLPIWSIYFMHISGQVFPFWLYVSCSWIMYFSYAVNPLLYCSNKQIRRSVKQLIC